MASYAKPRFVIQIPTGDKEPYPEWMELTNADGKRFRFVDKWDAEKVVAKLKRTQPDVPFRIHPLPE